MIVESDYFYVRVPLRTIKSTLCLSEANYPIQVDWGIAIFTNGKTPETTGELDKPVLGLNFLRVADLFLPVPIPMTCSGDIFYRGYCPAKSPEAAIAHWRNYIVDRRSKHGFRVTTAELKSNAERIEEVLKTFKDK
jgi:hypothetical protein